MCAGGCQCWEHDVKCPEIYRLSPTHQRVSWVHILSMQEGLGPALGVPHFGQHMETDLLKLP